MTDSIDLLFDMTQRISRHNAKSYWM